MVNVCMPHYWFLKVSWATASKELLRWDYANCWLDTWHRLFTAIIQENKSKRKHQQHIIWREELIIIINTVSEYECYVKVCRVWIISDASPPLSVCSASLQPAVSSRQRLHEVRQWCGQLRSPVRLHLHRRLRAAGQRRQSLSVWTDLVWHRHHMRTYVLHAHKHTIPQNMKQSLSNCEQSNFGCID